MTEAKGRVKCPTCGTIKDIDNNGFNIQVGIPLILSVVASIILLYV